MKEVELRAKAPKSIGSKVLSLGAKLISSTHENDTYYRFKDDKKRKIIFRIRRKGGKSIFTIKGSAKGEDIAWHEWNKEISDAGHLEKLFLSSGMIRLVQIDKHRKQYRYGKFEINIDDIKDLGRFIEAELIADDVAMAKQNLLKLFERLGIEKSQIINKGYVKLMLKEK